MIVMSITCSANCERVIHELSLTQQGELFLEYTSLLEVTFNSPRSKAESSSNIMHFVKLDVQL